MKLSGTLLTIATCLLPNRRYIIGRDSDADFIVSSTSVSRQQLELEVAEGHDITPLWITVLSRARSVINGTILKLNKNDTSTIKEEYTKERNISIKFKNSNKEDQEFLKIYWKEFNIWAVTPLPEHRADVRVFSEYIDKVTHYYNSNDNAYLEALARAIPIIGNKWIDLVNSRTDWLLLEYLDEDIQPLRSSLLQDITCVVPKVENWMQLMGGEVLENPDSDLVSFLKNYNPKKILIIDDNKHLENALKECSLNGLKVVPWDKFCEPTPLKRKRGVYQRVTTPEVTEVQTQDLLSESTPPLRKRAKYERVNRMHFFNLSAPEILESSNTNNEDSKTDREVVNVADIDDSKQSSNHSESSKTSSENTVNEEHVNSLIAKENEVTSVEETTITTPEHLKRDRKRVAPEDTSQLTKIARLDLKPKLTLVDAVRQTRQDAKEISKKELGLDQEPNLSNDLKNMAIVEDVEITRRDPPTSIPLNGNYSSRKNFKAFKKTPREKRDCVALATVTVDSDFKFSEPPPVVSQAEKTMERDFSGMMSEVKSLEPQLFVQEDDDDDDDDNISDVRYEGLSTKGRSNGIRFNGGGQEGVQDYDDDDDDDDDENDQPKFGFSR